MKLRPADVLPPLLITLAVLALAYWTLTRDKIAEAIAPAGQGSSGGGSTPITAPAASTNAGIVGTHFYMSETAVSASHPELVEAAPSAYLPNIQALARAVEVVRAYLGKPFTVLSWYRSARLNKAVGGSSTSQHMTASAMDVSVGDQTRGVFALMLSGTVVAPLGQVIYYPYRGFVHMALPSTRYPKPTFFVCTTPKVYKPVASVSQLSALGY